MKSADPACCRSEGFEFPPQVLRKISSRITNSVKGVNRVVFECTSKPPATIERESHRSKQRAPEMVLMIEGTVL